MTQGEKIKALREKHGYRLQSDFAKALGVSQATVSRWESGSRPVPAWAIPGVAFVLGLTVAGIRRGVDS